MEIVALLIAVAGIFVAVGIPLGVEASRRPQLRIERADDANQRTHEPYWRIVHVRVINEPLTGLRGRWLLRNVATGCRVSITFVSRSDGSRLQVPGRWSAAPEPFAIVAVGQGVTLTADPTKIPQTLRHDLSPDGGGEVVAVAIKQDGDADAYAFSSDSYIAEDTRRLAAYRLPDEAYAVHVTASAGGISASASFTLRNFGNSLAGLTLE